MESGQEVAALRRREGSVAARERVPRGPSAPWLESVWRLYPPALVTLFPVALLL